MVGYFLAFPTLLVLVERVVRVTIGLHKIPATITILDDQTLEIKASIPSERLWKYRAGQYVFLQVPKISFFQWHPFTVSACVEREMWLHIKVEGSWTKKLKALGGESGSSQIYIGINGPFGAPAQRFHDFDHTIIVGAGIGVTPFSGILVDLQTRDNQLHGGPNTLSGMTTGPGEKRSSISATQDGAQSLPGSPVSNSRTLLGSVDGDQAPPASHQFTKQGGVNSSSDDSYRRVDFHWMVRERNQLLWFSDLLNTVSRSQLWHHQNDEDCHLTININTHVTQKRKDIATHVYRWLLEMHRTEDHPESPLTGLINPTHFGRPDFEKILNCHYEDMKKMRTSSKEISGSESNRRLKVGVFFCGTPVIGEILADQCRILSARGRNDETKIEYHFMMEVFG